MDGFSQKLTDDKVNSLKDSIVKKFSKIRLARIKNSYNHDNNNFIKIKRYLILHNLRNFIFRTDNQIPKIDVTYFDIIKKMYSLSLKKDIKFNFVYLPSYSTLNLKPKKNIVDNYSRIKNFLFTENINFIDLNVEVFSNQKDNSIYFPFQKDGHYNEKGYKKIAEILAKYR